MSAENSAWWQGLDNYILGLDLGPSSLGWAIVECDADGQPSRVVQSGVRRFEAGVLGDIEGGRDESRATVRRDARGPRRQHWRRQWRMRKLFRVLTTAGLLPPSEDDSPDARHALLTQLDAQLRAELAPQQDRVAAHVFPYYLRAEAIDRALPVFAVGRALYHLAQRRGFLSNRKTARGDEDEGKVRSGIIHLQDEMEKAGVDTLGQFFARLDPEEQRIRARWTSRHMFLDEFERIWQRQAQEHPALTDELKASVFAAIFDQRPLKSQKGLIGRCELEPDKRRAPLACLIAQRFRIAQRVNDLRVTAPDGEVRELTPEEKQTLSTALQTVAELSWAAVKKLLEMKKSREYNAHWVFNMEEGGDKRIVGNRTAEKLAKMLGEAWLALTSAEQERLVDEMISFESEDALAQRLVSGWKLPLPVAHAASQLVFEQGTAALSRKAISKLLKRMEDQGESYSTARKAVYGESFQAGKVYDELPPVKPTNKERDGAFRELRNPAVERAMSEMRKVVNAVIGRCGKPKLVRVELTRDLKHNRQRRKEMTDRRDRNTDTRDKARKRILDEMGEKFATPANILKVRLADECGWICPFTGKQIGMKALVGNHPQFDIEHIIPFSRSLDNSFINKTICHHEENRNRKRNQMPHEAYNGTPQYDEIIQRVKRFNSDVRSKKLALFQTEQLPDDKDFSEKLLSDTRYISRLASQYLGLLYGGKLKFDEEGTLRVQVSPGRATAYLRQRWNLNSIIGHDDEKNRSDHRHHAIDAIVIALTDTRAVQLLAHAAEEAEDHGDPKLFADVKSPWPSFMDEARAAITRINVSSRVSRKLNGPLHEGTNFSKPKTEVDGKGRQVAVHYVRKPLGKMSDKEVEDIVDRRVRELVQERLKALGVPPQKAFNDASQHPHFLAKNGRVIPIHKARIRKSVRPISVGRGSGKRYVAPGSNHHLEIIAILDEDGRELRWEGKMVSRFDAIQRRFNKEKIVQRDHGPGKQFKFSLAPSECLILSDQLYVVSSISEEKKQNGTKSQKIEFLLHTDARPTTVIRKTSRKGLSGNPDALRKANARKVIVDPLGDIHPARD